MTGMRQRDASERTCDVRPYPWMPTKPKYPNMISTLGVTTHEVEPEDESEEQSIASHSRPLQQPKRQQIECPIRQSRAGKADQCRSAPVAACEHGCIVDALADVDQQHDVAMLRSPQLITRGSLL